MKPRPAGVAVLALLAAGLPAFAQLRPAAAALPVTRIVLFSSGVGYFQREGEVDGNARVDLQFHAANINDLLKSLILEDAGGGKVGAVSYDNRDPVEKTLKSFAIDLTQSPTLGQLLAQVRGQRVEVVTYGEQGREGKPVTLSGQIVGVERKTRPIKDQVVIEEQLNLLTDDGLHGLELAKVQRVKFVKPELEQEFRRALEVLAAGTDKQKKTVSLQFLGGGKRPVRVGYVTESPLWKTSYRLALGGDGEPKDKPHLQGWAVVENTTDEDWSNVRLGLVSGRPISFRMDLYEPLYVPRPLVEPDLFASLRPPSYSGDLAEKGKALEDRKGGEDKDEADGERRPTGQMGGAFASKAPASPRGANAKDALGRLGEGERDKEIDLRRGVASAAVATELGEYFKYEIEQPVNLARQKSALLPIVNGPAEAQRVSIYNESVHAKFPLLGLRLKNTTGLHLMQGPVTVLDAGGYAGDARLPDLQPNETRLVSYAVDLGTEVAPETPQAADNLVAARLFKGVLFATHKVRYQRSYTVKNRSDKERLVLVEHPVRQGLALVSPEKPAEKARDVYRFEVKAEPNQPAKLNVIEEQQRVDQIVLTNSPDESVQVFLRSSAISPRVKEALERALKLKTELSETQHLIAREEQALKIIEQDQGRMRANMQRVPPTSEAYKRYLKKFDDQETELEKRRAQVVRLQETAEKQRQAYESFLLNLNVE